MPNASARAAHNSNTEVNNNTGGRSGPGTTSGTEEDLLAQLGLDISVLTPVTVRPTVTRGSAGKARKPLDAKTVNALVQSLEAAKKGEYYGVPLVRTNQDWTNEVQRTVTHWAKDQRASGVMVSTGEKDVPADYKGDVFKVSAIKHPKSPNTKSPKPEDAKKQIIYVLGISKVTPEAQTEEKTDEQTPEPVSA